MTHWSADLLVVLLSPREIRTTVQQNDTEDGKKEKLVKD